MRIITLALPNAKLTFSNRAGGTRMHQTCWGSGASCVIVQATVDTIALVIYLLLEDKLELA